jgi:hypothetical protein
LEIEKFNYAILHSRDAMGAQTPNSEIFKLNKSLNSEDSNSVVKQSENIQISENANRELSEDSVDKNELIYKVNIRKKKLLSIQILWIVMMGFTFVLTALQVFLYVKGASGKD